MITHISKSFLPQKDWYILKAIHIAGGSNIQFNGFIAYKRPYINGKEHDDFDLALFEDLKSRFPSTTFMYNTPIVIGGDEEKLLKSIDTGVYENILVSVAATYSDDDFESLKGKPFYLPQYTFKFRGSTNNDPLYMSIFKDSTTALIPYAQAEGIKENVTPL